MPTFDTPEPIVATIEVPDGNVWIRASDRTDTVVEVRPDDDCDDADADADGDGEIAAQTQVEYAQGRLVVRPRERKARWWVLEWDVTIDVTVDLPTGSRVEVTSGTADVRCDGRLGAVRIGTSDGEVRLDETGELQVSSSSGDISVNRSVGPTEVATADGEIRIGQIDGPAVVKTSSGDITLGEVTHDARVNTADGDITIHRALTGAVARTASGSIRIDQVMHGSVDLETADGDLEVGVPRGTAAWLDLHSVDGDVHCDLDPADAPGPVEETVKVRARTGSGDVVIRHA